MWLASRSDLEGFEFHYTTLPFCTQSQTLFSSNLRISLYCPCCGRAATKCFHPPTCLVDISELEGGFVLDCGGKAARLDGQILTGKHRVGHDGPLSAEQWFSRLFRELRRLMPRKWRGFLLKNLFSSLSGPVCGTDDICELKTK
ncbi:hypothetical protein O6P43_018557 [Quillaja saponaria]|uniref:Uncharacterized protein n=1 Tax=Quillaja saponaria TaxID=32244 RepID=A0AAD7LUT7_QUISA|nr:hypothetical protein O6P43_018557 [Quillaja saponaria]